MLEGGKEMLTRGVIQRKAIGTLLQEEGGSEFAEGGLEFANRGAL